MRRRGAPEPSLSKPSCLPFKFNPLKMRGSDSKLCAGVVVAKIKLFWTLLGPTWTRLGPTCRDFGSMVDLLLNTLTDAIGAFWPLAPLGSDSLILAPLLGWSFYQYTYLCNRWFLAPGATGPRFLDSGPLLGWSFY